jgi:hypothetical protein
VARAERGRLVEQQGLDGRQAEVGEHLVPVAQGEGDLERLVVRWCRRHVASQVSAQPRIAAVKRR